MIYDRLTGWIIIKCDIGILFLSFTRILEFYYNVTKMIGRPSLHEDIRTLTVISRSFIFRMIHFQTSFSDKFKAYILCSIYFSTFVPYIREFETNSYKQTGHKCQHNNAHLLC